MNFNNLKCRCGSMDHWGIEWVNGEGEKWELCIVCENCGAAHYIAEGDSYNAMARELRPIENKK